MEYRFSPESLISVERKARRRGFGLIFFAMVLALLLLFPIAWYFSLIPSLIFLLLGANELRGAYGGIRKIRQDVRFVTTSDGIQIHTSPERQPFRMFWKDMSIEDETLKKGVLTNFTVRTGDKHWKTQEFTNDIESFSDLYRTVCQKLKT